MNLVHIPNSSGENELHLNELFYKHTDFPGLKNNRQSSTFLLIDTVGYLTDRKSKETIMQTGPDSPRPQDRFSNICF